VNPHAAKSISPLTLVQSLRLNRRLIYDLAKREVVGRYKGSLMGLLWSFLNPILMLAVYTFVFSVVFKARWVGGTGSRTEFALMLFTGLMVFNVFSECVNRAPSLIVGNVNYVKKVVFPLEVLPIVAMGAAFFHFLVSLLVWLAFYIAFFGFPPPTIGWVFVALIPFVTLTIGICWALASLGVFLRDVTQVVAIATTVLMFLSPIFYPIASLPKEFQPIMQANPLTFVIEQTRDVMILGHGMDWPIWTLHFVLSVFLGWMGFAWFQKTRKGFADVL
jgi:lipopolysaccharide transport system permease protein